VRVKLQFKENIAFHERSSEFVDAQKYLSSIEAISSHKNGYNGIYTTRRSSERELQSLVSS
jgi:hypothetical protein